MLVKVLYDIKMQSLDVKCAKTCLLKVQVCVCVAKGRFSCVLMWLCVSVHKTFFFFFHSASQAVGAGGNCGGRELVRAVSLGDVNMAMLSWHRT